MGIARVLTMSKASKPTSFSISISMYLVSFFSSRYAKRTVKSESTCSEPYDLQMSKR